MCSMSEFADVKEDLSCDTGDTGDSDKLDTLSESSSDTLDHKNSDGLSNPVICVDICEQNMCDAGPCKKQRVTTKSAASDLQSIFHSTENNLNNSSVYSGPDWSSDQDNLNNDVCCNRGNTSCRVGKSSSPNCLCMCMENVLNPVVRSNNESFSSSFNHPDDCVENVDDSESKNCLPHFVGNDERQEKRSDELSSFESYIPLSVNHSSSNDLDNIKDEKYFDKQIAGSTCELSSLNKSDRPLEDYNFLNQKENIKADNNLYPTSDVKRPEISSNSVNVEVEEKKYIKIKKLLVPKENIPAKVIRPHRNYDNDTRDLRIFRFLLDSNTNCCNKEYHPPTASTSTSASSAELIGQQTTLAVSGKNMAETQLNFIVSDKNMVDGQLPEFETDILLGRVRFSDLPFAILLNIFQYLSVYDLLCKVCLVCRQWHEASHDPSLWRRISLVGQSKLSDSALDRVTSYSDRVLYLDLTDCREKSVSESGFISMLKKCRYLKTLKIARHYGLTEDAFVHIGMCCPALRHINFDLCYSCVTDKTLTAVGEGCPYLECLYMSQCAKISDEGIVALTRGCPRLRQLGVDQCGKIGDRSLQELADNCPDLEFLHLLSCGLTDDGIQHLSKLLNLRMLDISNIRQLSSKCVEGMVRACKKLEVLSVSLNRAIDDECIRVIVQQCHSLKKFSCVACNLTDKALEYMGMYSKSLERIDVAWCGDITDIGVRFISENLASLQYLGLLRCSQITMETIDELVEKFPHIYYSNFVLESRKLMRQAEKEGFRIPLPVKEI